MPIGAKTVSELQQAIQAADLRRRRDMREVRQELVSIRDILADAYPSSLADSGRSPSASAGTAGSRWRSFLRWLRVPTGRA